MRVRITGMTTCWGFGYGARSRSVAVTVTGTTMETWTVSLAVTSDQETKDGDQATKGSTPGDGNDGDHHRGEVLGEIRD